MPLNGPSLHVVSIMTILHLRNAQLLHVGKYIRNHLVIAVDKIFLSYYPL